MPDFSLLGFAGLLQRMVGHTDYEAQVSLHYAARIVAEEAQSVLGTHDYGWDPLAPSTIERKETGDSPLLETGQMRDSIGYFVDRDRLLAHVGSNDDAAVWHELGTTRAPARSFLVEAAVRKEPEVREILGKGALRGLFHNPDHGGA